MNAFHQVRKHENLKRERRRLGSDIIGVSEARCTGVAEYEDDEVKIIYSGGETHRTGVGIMIIKALVRCVRGYFVISDRILLVKLAGAPLDMNIVQVHAPTAGHDDGNIEGFYACVDYALKQC